ncbi:MAG: Gfo/Idh/MocA family oxidoreductase, partial [Fibrella sp.]|nr:Gfo/Idh/MocA family oxidoreductase [Armatimonadota bacterium]
MKTRKIGIIMNGVTGRMGTNQHLLRSVAAIVQAGGMPLSDGETLIPDPVLVGRNAAKLEALANRSGINARFSTDLDAVLDDPYNEIYFDAQLTQLRAPAVKKAIQAGKHIYCEKPSGTTTAEAYELYTLAKTAGVKQGVVQDKLFLPGLVKLNWLIESGFFGEILSVRGEFGYWVFTGHDQIPVQRPSWNYRKEDG